jgi:hypothetical protein
MLIATDKWVEPMPRMPRPESYLYVNTRRVKKAKQDSEATAKGTE